MKASIPTPTVSTIELGPSTFHIYALCIIAGVAVAIWCGNRRFSGNNPEYASVVSSVAVFAIPSGVVGGRLYHVLTSPDRYFGSDGNFWAVFKIWQGGLGIWGAISLGSLGAYFSYRKLSKKIALPSFLVFADALAPGLLLAQAIGRWGNWFNGELFGRPLNAPWALEIPPYLRPAGYENFHTFHPAFLYESLWCIAAAAFILATEKWMKTGSIFSAYIALYCVGRFAIESIRIDPAQTFGGMRLNQYVSLLILAGAIFTFTRNQGRSR